MVFTMSCNGAGIWGTNCFNFASNPEANCRAWSNASCEAFCSARASCISFSTWVLLVETFDICSATELNSRS